MTGAHHPSVTCVLASTLTNDGYIIIQGRVCQIISVAQYVYQMQEIIEVHAYDIFTGSKIEGSFLVDAMAEIPKVGKKEYQLIHIDKSSLSLAGSDETPRNDLKLPAGNLRSAIMDAFDEGKTVFVSVLSALGNEQVVAYRVQWGGMW
ncbi:uncharacterized protein L203_100380 [Cryptococcus depauperatus CBS 7841]|uniref:Translation initiation factor 5A C-terminal domain-containing protein n=1 Tax=Cryptococcus depauperatus CBS 7841 TaxID=1295531 RepID=A0AAJ8JMY3_9TREE